LDRFKRALSQIQERFIVAFQSLGGQGVKCVGESRCCFAEQLPLFFQVRLGFLELCFSRYSELTFSAQVTANGSEFFQGSSRLLKFRLCRCLLLTLRPELLLQGSQLLILLLPST
jgi:hypothetical protein